VIWVVLLFEVVSAIECSVLRFCDNPLLYDSYISVLIDLLTCVLCTILIKRCAAPLQENAQIVESVEMQVIVQLPEQFSPPPYESILPPPEYQEPNKLSPEQEVKSSS